MIALHRRLRRRMQRVQKDEAGLAMIIAISVVMLMTLIPLAIFSQAIQQLPLARHDQNHESALAAAEAGVDDYLTHLAQNQNYWTYSASNPDPVGNTAFTAWKAVPGGNPNNQYFRYNVNTSQTASTGIVYLTSSGCAIIKGTTCTPNSPNNLIRTVKVGLRRQGFLDYLWLTDYEITDPALSGASVSSCKFRAWEWNSAASKYGPNDVSACQAVFWTSSAVLNGPVHSNDGLYMCGNPVFNGDTNTYYNSPTSRNVPNSMKFAGPGVALNPNSCTNNPTYARVNDPAGGQLLAFPPANTSIKTQADAALGGTGCMYTGPTTILLKNTGKMDVTSAKTRSTNPGCGPGTNLNLPSNGVIYVQNIPTSTSNPNYSSCSGTGCLGDVNLSGTLKGQLTIASEDDIVLTGTTRYNTYPGGDDVLGLVADNDVAVAHAANANVTADFRVDAAILSLNHSFYVQNWNKGAVTCDIPTPCTNGSNLIINGVITQEYRGPVGTFKNNPPVIISGYNKQYTYDTRLKYLSPPYFLSPTQSAWGRISYGELMPTANP